MYVNFGSVARGQLGQQCQYARKWLVDPVLGAGIRWQGRYEDYHSLVIHADDVTVWVERVRAWQRATGQIP